MSDFIDLSLGVYASESYKSEEVASTQLVSPLNYLSSSSWMFETLDISKFEKLWSCLNGFVDLIFSLQASKSYCVIWIFWYILQSLLCFYLISSLIFTSHFSIYWNFHSWLYGEILLLISSFYASSHLIFACFSTSYS